MVAIAYSTAHSANQPNISWAVLASLALHIMLLLQLPARDVTIPEKPEQPVLKVALALNPTIVQPSAEVMDSPAEPMKPPVDEMVPAIPKVSPKPAPRPSKAVSRPAPPHVSEKLAEQESAAAPESPPTPDIMTVPARESATATPAPQAMAPEESPAPSPPSASGPSQQDIDAARNLYGSLLSRAIAKYKQYPRIAQMRGWQGEVLLEVHCDETGHVLSTAIKKSSGHNVLDEQAITMVKKASPLPQPPEILRNSKRLVILVPVPFTLESS